MKPGFTWQQVGKPQTRKRNQRCVIDITLAALFRVA